VALIGKMGSASPQTPQASLPAAQSSGATVKSQEKPAEPAEPQTPAQIILLETHYRFETDGSSRKEVHTLVKINSELGVRQFAHLNFDYNRAWQSIEIPIVRVTHSSGGTADVLPSAIADVPNEAVKDAPAYQDVRVKSVRILGLEPSDTLEYRVITTSGKGPLAPNFWLDHSFDRTGVVSKELFEIDAPEPHIRIRIDPATPAATTEKSGEGHSARVLYRWTMTPDSAKRDAQQPPTTADVALTTFSSWSKLSNAIYKTSFDIAFGTGLWSDAMRKIGAVKEPVPPRALYAFVAGKITTIDLPLDLAMSIHRSPGEILASGYGSSAEKVALLAALIAQDNVRFGFMTYGTGAPLQQELPRPSLISGALLALKERGNRYFLDPGLEVAPFGMLPADARGKKGLRIAAIDEDTNDVFTAIPDDLPFAARQRVAVDAALDGNGTLTAKVKYVMRGDNELLLRIAFHQSPREKWASLAQLLSLSDGFRGQIVSVSASNPLDSKEPFTVEYEIAQPKFVDWSKKPVRIPALLPLFALPDPPAQPNSPIELGTPLDVEATATLTLPPGSTVQPPSGTSVNRGYATFASKYSGPAAGGNALTASRHINFLARQLPALSNADYRAFLRAVQNDEAQTFTLTKP
jgi:hypothetical protein